MKRVKYRPSISSALQVQERLCASRPRMFQENMSAIQPILFAIVDVEDQVLRGPVHSVVVNQIQQRDHPHAVIRSAYSHMSGQPDKTLKHAPGAVETES